MGSKVSERRGVGEAQQEDAWLRESAVTEGHPVLRRVVSRDLEDEVNRKHSILLRRW